MIGRHLPVHNNQVAYLDPKHGLSHSVKHNEKKQNQFEYSNCRCIISLTALKWLYEEKTHLDHVPYTTPGSSRENRGHHFYPPMKTVFILVFKNMIKK